METKDFFSLKKAGKQLPYGVADDFFNKSHDEICDKIHKHEKVSHLRRRIRLISLNAAAVLVISLTSAIIMNSHKKSEKAQSESTEIGISEVLKSLSDEDIKQLEYNSQTDPFLEGD